LPIAAKLVVKNKFTGKENCIIALFIFLFDRRLDVVGILDIDWQSLISQTKEKQTATPAGSDVMERFAPSNFFKRIGISKAFAGSERSKAVEELIGEC